MVEESAKYFQTNKSNQNYSSKDGRYQTLFEQVNAAAFLINLDGKILEANQKSCELLDYTWEELMQKSLKDIFPPNYNWEQFVEEISSKGGEHFESENVKKDGTTFPVDVDASIFTQDNKPVILTLMWDITKRKKAEQELRENKEKYEGLFEYSTDAMLVLDARGEILDVNSSASLLFGLEKSDLIGRNFLSSGLLTPKALSIVVQQFQELLSRNKSSTIETEITDNNKNLLNVELSSFFLLKKDTEIDNFVLVIRNISDRKKTEIKLAREHELLQTLMDSIPDSIYFKDEENRFIMVNKSKAAHSNVKPGDMIGKTDFDFLPPDEAKKAFEDDEEIMKTGKFIINKPEKVTNKDGGVRWLSVTKIPRFDPEGNIIGTMGISRDITEWKKLEEMYKKS